MHEEKNSMRKRVFSKIFYISLLFEELLNRIYYKYKIIINQTH